MRISSASMHRLANQDMMKYQVEMANIQAQLSSGKRLNKPSDDPVDASRRIDVKERMNQVEQYIRNTNFAEARLVNEEAHLANSEEVLMRIRELALVTNNAATSATDYPAIKSELLQLRDNLLYQANAKDTDGNYIFAGSKTSTKPIIPGNPTTYGGDDETRMIQVNQGLTIQSGDSGKEIFLRIDQSKLSHTMSVDTSNTGTASASLSSAGIGTQPPNHTFELRFTSSTTFDLVDTTTGTVEIAAATIPESQSFDYNGLQIAFTGEPAAGDVLTMNPTERQDVFRTLDEFIALLDNPPQTGSEKAVQRQLINNTLENVDQAFNHITLKRAEVGSRLATLDVVKQENEASDFQLRELLSDIEDLDYASAISSLQQHATALEALQKTITRTQNLSLFNSM